MKAGKAEPSVPQQDDGAKKTATPFQAPPLLLVINKA